MPELLALSPEATVFTSLPKTYFPAGSNIIHNTSPFSENGVLRKIRALINYQNDFEKTLQAHSIDVLFCPFNAEGLRSPKHVKQVLIVHDLIPVLFPEHFPITRHLWRWLYRVAIERSKRVVCVSQHTRSDLVSRLNYPTQRTRVAYNGGPKRRGLASNSGRRQGNGWILCVASAHYPHKNIAHLLMAYAEVSNELSEDLIIVGSRVKRFTPSLMVLAQNLGIAGRVHWRERLGDIEMTRLYEGAKMLVYPSRYEGFGLPVLEAMAAGIPVCASFASSVPEVAGDAAEYFSPESPQDMARAIRLLVTSDERRQKLINCGFANLERFCWSSTARNCLEACDEAWREQ